MCASCLERESGRSRSLNVQNGGRQQPLPAPQTHLLIAGRRVGGGSWGPSVHHRCARTQGRGLGVTVTFKRLLLGDTMALVLAICLSNPYHEGIGGRQLPQCPAFPPNPCHRLQAALSSPLPLGLKGPSSCGGRPSLSALLRPLGQWLSARGAVAHRDIWPELETFLAVTPGGVAHCWHPVGCCLHPTRHRAAAHGRPCSNASDTHTETPARRSLRESSEGVGVGQTSPS